jgi:TolA-binding protein
MAKIVCSAWLITALSGCFLWTTSGEGDQMQRDLAAQGERLKKLEDAQNAQLEQLKQAEAKAQQSIDELQNMIEKATSVVQRNSADVTVQVADLQSKLAVDEGRIAELQYTLEQVSKAQADAQAAAAKAASSQPTTSGGEAAGADAVPADKSDHYAAAYKAFTDKNYAKSRTLFRAYVDKYKDDAQADNAQYWIGASYLVENRPATALGELRKVIENYRNGDAVDEALMDMAEAFYRLKACSDAKTTLDTLIKTQTKSPLLDKAKEKLKAIKKLGSDYCTS